MRSWERSSSGTTRSTEIKRRRSEATGCCSRISRSAKFLDRRVEGVDNPVTLGQRPGRLAVAIQERIGRPGHVLSDHGQHILDSSWFVIDSPKLAAEIPVVPVVPSSRCSVMAKAI